MIARRVGEIEGIVQGVGFRPFLARLASELGLAGRVRNEGRVVRVELEGDEGALGRFEALLVERAPAAARIDRASFVSEVPRGERGFTIEHSAVEGERALTIPPDLATCDECRAEVADPSARRSGYPFTNCTACGPRYTIVESLPYDRPRTTMARFPMCEACRREYDDPADRRYHAQPIACPACGPALRLLDREGAPLAGPEEALVHAIEALGRGAIVALKGLGGWQLACDARDEGVVRRLRERKRRPHQAFAVMVRDLESARALACVSEAEARALSGAAAPIVLLRKRGRLLAPSIAPDNGRVGLMLPTTPLHHLLLARFAGPLVCTSGNLHDEPIVTGDGEAVARLGAIADLFLGHDRPIARRVDDGVCHVIDGEARTLRLGRGLGPLRLSLGAGGPPLLCAGGHLKNAPAATVDGDAVLWPHVGDLDDPSARDALVEALDELRRFLALDPVAVACDLHPDYASTRWAEQSGLPRIGVQHHHAHVAACLAEHGVDEALGFAWDGVGLGDDRTPWGGEALRVGPRGFERVAHLRPFPLPGGDAAARDPRRSLAGLFVAAGVDAPAGLVPDALVRLARSPRLAPWTTSAGRLFDAVAALTGVCERASFEGQAPIALERLAEPGHEPYPFRLDGPVVDWTPALGPLLADRGDPSRAASRFHATLVASIVAVAERERAPAVALTGGCFQNPLLATETLHALRARGHRVLLPSRVPPNDGGLALGQAWIAHHLILGDRPQ